MKGSRPWPRAKGNQAIYQTPCPASPEKRDAGTLELKAPGSDRH
jgi:hypothetical protein